MKISPFAPFKILTCYDKIDQILKGEMPVPQTVELFVSDRCNHNCLGCHSKVLHNSSKNFLDFKIVRRLFKEISEWGVRGIEISGGGEPLLHPDILKIITSATKNRMKVGLFTNGTLLNKEIIDVFLSHLLFVRIAFNATNDNLYKKIHGKGDLNKVVENISTLIAERKRKKSQTAIGLKMLISKSNYSEIINVAKRAKLLEVDYIQFKPLRKSSHAIPKTMAVFVKESIEEARRLFSEDNFKVLGSVEKTEMKTRCFLNPLHPVIDTTGDVYLCAFFQHRMDSHWIGNLSQNSFKEIWYSPRHFKAFKENDHRKCGHFDCPLQMPLKFIKDSIIDNKIHAEFV